MRKTLTLGIIVVLYCLIARLPQTDEIESQDTLTQQDVQRHFASITDRMTHKYIKAKGEILSNVTLKGLDKTDEPIAVEVAPIHWLSCGCCWDEPQHTPFYDADLQIVCKLAGLQNLTIARTSITDQGIAAVHRHPSLKRLSLKGCDITDSSLRHLAGINTLEELDLSKTKITGAGLVFLTKLPNLRALNLESTLLSDDSLAHLSGMPLRSLNLTKTPISGEGFSAVRRSQDGMARPQTRSLARRILEASWKMTASRITGSIKLTRLPRHFNALKPKGVK